MSPINRWKQGSTGEDLASQFLEKNGLKILTRNYRFERGEIDIIAEDGEEIVFVEVKARRTSSYGTPEDAVTDEKQDQIRTVAEGYLYEKNIDNRPCRFDIVAIEFKDGKAEVRHIRNAF
jgi:putative endonuclease